MMEQTIPTKPDILSNNNNPQSLPHPKNEQPKNKVCEKKKVKEK